MASLCGDLKSVKSYFGQKRQNSPPDVLFEDKEAKISDINQFCLKRQSIVRFYFQSHLTGYTAQTILYVRRKYMYVIRRAGFVKPCHRFKGSQPRGLHSLRRLPLCVQMRDPATV